MPPYYPSVVQSKPLYNTTTHLDTTTVQFIIATPTNYHTPPHYPNAVTTATLLHTTTVTHSLKHL